MVDVPFPFFFFFFFFCFLKAWVMVGWASFLGQEGPFPSKGPTLHHFLIQYTSTTLKLKKLVICSWVQALLSIGARKENNFFFLKRNLEYMLLSRVWFSNTKCRHYWLIQWVVYNGLDLILSTSYWCLAFVKCPVKIHYLWFFLIILFFSFFFSYSC